MAHEVIDLALDQDEVDPVAILGPVRRRRPADRSEIAVGESRPLEQLVATALAGRRYQTQLFVAFGLVAIFIATVGVYAVASCGVSPPPARDEHQDCARRSNVARRRLAAAAGHGAGRCRRRRSSGCARGWRDRGEPSLRGSRARSAVIATVVGIVALVGLATCGIAARRGLSLDPAAALRDE